MFEKIVKKQLNETEIEEWELCSEFHENQIQSKLWLCIICKIDKKKLSIQTQTSFTHRNFFFLILFRFQDI